MLLIMLETFLESKIMSMVVDQEEAAKELKKKKDDALEELRRNREEKSRSATSPRVRIEWSSIVSSIHREVVMD